MLNTFDWLRLCRAGGELLVTLQYIDPQTGYLTLLGDEAETSADSSEVLTLAPPLSALHQPCQRCWLYQPKPEAKFCAVCDTVLTQAKAWGATARKLVVLWAYLNRLPRSNLLDYVPLTPPYTEEGAKLGAQVFGAYRADGNRFLLLLTKHALKPWLQQLVLYHGAELQGLIQVFPTMGKGQRTDMADVLSRAIHHEARFPMDRLRVRFYSEPKQVVMPMERDQAGLLTFDLTNFMSLLEMTAIFKTQLWPSEQEALYQVLILPVHEKAFYWGRMMGELRPVVRDMINAWEVHSWPAGKITLMYELLDYVAIY